MDLQGTAFVLQCWRQVMEGYAVPAGPTRDQAFADLVRCYSEPHRHYHSLIHLEELLSILVGRTKKTRDWRPGYLAAYYHDVVYEPRRQDNEAESAKFAAIALANLGLDTRVIERACQLIQWTANHAAPDDDADALLFLGADLGILSASAERYQAYRHAIRLEYEWVPERDFLAGRKRVLEGFRNRPKIYRSEHLAHFEEPARRNLSAEIAEIDEMLRNLPP